MTGDTCYTEIVKIAAPRSTLPDLLVRIGLAMAFVGLIGLAIAHFIPPRGL